MTLPISVCLIVKDEAERLPACLAALSGHFAQVIAYDSGSTDATLKILSDHGVTTLCGPWLGFSATRMALWSCANQDWILWLDADEVLSPQILAALQAIDFTQPDPLIGGYRLCRQVVFQGRTIRHGDWYPDWVLRLFRRSAYTMADRAVHESVSVPGQVIDLPGVLPHYSFRSWADLRARSQRYAQLWASQALSDGRRSGGAWEPYLRASWKFIRGFLLKSGWLDGMLGYKIALHNAYEVFFKYSLLRR